MIFYIIALWNSTISFQELEKTVEKDKQNISLLKSASEKLLRHTIEANENRLVVEHSKDAIKKREEVQRAIERHISTLLAQIDKANEFNQANEMIKEWIPKTEEALVQAEQASKEPSDVKAQIRILEVEFN